MIKTPEDYQRRFSLEEDFMSYTTDDLLYGAMQYLATYHPALRKLYISKKTYTKSRKELRNICGTTQQTLNNHLKKLIEKNLIKEETVIVGDNKEEVEAYTFPYDFNMNYQLVNNEMLWYIVSTRNNQAVRVYIQLLNWYNWKKEIGETFVFTNVDIMKKLGYSTESKNAVASSMVSNILESFQREGVIDFAEYYEETIDKNGYVIQVPRKRLLFVASTKKEMKNRN